MIGGEQVKRVPWDGVAYTRRAREGPCLVCSLLAGDPSYRHHILYESEHVVAFLVPRPTLWGYAIVAPKQHAERLVEDLSLTEYLDLQAVVYRVAGGIAKTVPTERVYVLSLGSQQGNAHVHWHVAPLPPGLPYERQQYFALMAEHGVLTPTWEQLGELAAAARPHIAARPDDPKLHPRAAGEDTGGHLPPGGLSRSQPDPIVPQYLDLGTVAPGRFDGTAMVRLAREGPCFVCATLAGHPEYPHHILYQDADVVAFLARRPTLMGATIVAPTRHAERLEADLTLTEHLHLHHVTYQLGRALSTVLPTERIYVLSLGSQQGNAHIHWGIAPLPPGVPYEHQQFHATMGETGTLSPAPQQQQRLADALRARLRSPGL